MKKFTFKTEKPTGRYSSFYDPTHHIKLNGKECGYITAKTFKIKLMVDVPNYETWKWITLAKKFDSLDEAKKWLNDNHEKIQTQFKIHTAD